MALKTYYTSCECYDEPDNDLMFKITSFDEECFEVEIKTVISKNNLDILDKIKQAIIEMSEAK